MCKQLADPMGKLLPTYCPCPYSLVPVPVSDITSLPVLSERTSMLQKKCSLSSLDSLWWCEWGDQFCPPTAVHTGLCTGEKEDRVCYNSLLGAPRHKRWIYHPGFCFSHLMRELSTCIPEWLLGLVVHVILSGHLLYKYILTKTYF